MKETSDASKARDNEERRNRIARDEKGNILTGAGHFAMGQLYKNASLARLMATEEHQQIIQNWIKGAPCFLTISGVPGTGKTFLSASILNYFFEKNVEIFYTSHRRLMQFIQTGIAEGRSQYETLNKVAYKEILILDDLGSGTNTDWQQEMILELLDIRYSQKLKTLITSNYDRSELSDYLGNRTASRLYDANNKYFSMGDVDNRKIERED